MMSEGCAQGGPGRDGNDDGTRCDFHSPVDSDRFNGAPGDFDRHGATAAMGAMMMTTAREATFTTRTTVTASRARKEAPVATVTTTAREVTSTARTTVTAG